jgi:hypothetical protein
MLCNHCKKMRHLADFCIQPSGKMAGQSIDDACTAQWAAAECPPCIDLPSSKAPGPSSMFAKVASFDAPPASSGLAPDSIIIGGVTYYPGSSVATSTASVAIAQGAHIESLSASSDDSDTSYCSYLAIRGPIKASVDWTVHTRAPDPLSLEPSSVLSMVSWAFLAHPIDCSFILDSGATNHISPEHSDFKML